MAHAEHEPFTHYGVIKKLHTHPSMLAAVVVTPSGAMPTLCTLL